MRLPVPGPRDVVHLIERGTEAVGVLLAAAPRISALLDEAGPLLAKARALVGQIGETRAAADDVVRRIEQMVAEADDLVARTGPLTERLAGLLDSTEPSLVALQPTLERLAVTTDSREVDALVSLVDHLPVLAQKVEIEIVPVLESLTSVSPDLRDLLDVSRELNGMMASVPGLGRVKKRIDEEQAERDSASETGAATEADPSDA